MPRLPPSFPRRRPSERDDAAAQFGVDVALQARIWVFPAGSETVEGKLAGLSEVL